jgi:transmembrane sensor
MTSNDAQRLRQAVLAEAGRWFVELNEHPEDEATRREFDRWMRRSPENVQAFLQVSMHWEESAPGPGASVDSIDALVALTKPESNVVHLAPAERAAPAMHAGPSSNAQPTSRRFAVAACLLLSLAGALVWQQFFRGMYSTAVGEQRSFTLADGSIVELNSRTRIRVRYSEERRYVELLEGQALFHVAKNHAQPFVVRSGDTQVRAVGTQFDIYRKATGTIVTVVEGRVAVAAGGDAPDTAVTGSGSNREQHGVVPAAAHPTITMPDHTVFLDAGQQITLALDASVPVAPARLEPSAVEAATAWTRRRLIFKSTPLAEVAQEFNRYSERRIVVVDAAIATIPISGSFSSNDSADFLRFLREVGAYQVRETASAIEISRK